MASQIGICNRALLRLGEPPLASLDLNNKAANALRAIWDDCRDQVLVEHPWNFASRRAVLAPLSAAPAFGYSYAYQLPSDCLRVLGLVGSDAANVDPTLEYKVEDRQLLTDESSVQIKYVARVEVAGLFSPAFATALGAYLAQELAYYLTEDPGLTKLLFEMYEGKDLPAAKAIDAQEDTPTSYQANPWLEARL